MQITIYLDITDFTAKPKKKWKKCQEKVKYILKKQIPQNFCFILN